MRLVIGNGAAKAIDGGLASLIARAIVTRNMFLAGRDDSIDAMASQLGVRRDYVAVLVRLSYLSPEIVGAILVGQQPVALTPTRLVMLSRNGLSLRLAATVAVMWLAGRLVPDHKTIADFRKDNGPAIRKVCAHFVAVCREMGLLTKASVAIDGSKFKAVNNRDKNFTRAKMERRLAQIEESVARYLSQLDTAGLQEPTEALAAKTAHLKEKLAKLATGMQRLKAIATLGQCDNAPGACTVEPTLLPRTSVSGTLAIEHRR